MFRYAELAAWLQSFPCALLGASASGVLALGYADEDLGIAADSAAFASLCDWEERLAQEVGALDLGTHILFALERREGTEQGHDANSA